MGYIPLKYIKKEGSNQEDNNNNNINIHDGFSHTVIKSGYFDDKNKVVFFLVLLLTLYINFSFLLPLLDHIIQGLVGGKIWDFGFLQINLYEVIYLVVVISLLVSSFKVAENVSREY
jgi:hypothetical protein